MDFFGLSKLIPLSLAKRPSLPILQEENFASSIISLEMEIEVGKFSVEDVQTLVKLYSRAVEYYVASQSNYCIYFQNKIKQLLLRPNVMSIIESTEETHDKLRTPNNDIENVEPNLKTRNDESKPKLPVDLGLKKQGIQLNKDLIVAHQSRDLNKLLMNFKVAEDVKNDTFNKALHDQMAQLGKRVQRRRQSVSIRRSMNLSKDCTGQGSTNDGSSLLGKLGDRRADRRDVEAPSGLLDDNSGDFKTILCVEPEEVDRRL